MKPLNTGWVHPINESGMSAILRRDARNSRAYGDIFGPTGTVRYVSRLIRLAFLAPDIVESIVAGRQPSDLTTQALTRRTAIPLEWRSQKFAFNIQ
jgi:hypothetical protein